MQIDTTRKAGTERQLNRKITKRIMPILALGMFISYIDRANLGVISEPLSLDLGLTASSFALAAGFFYIGYLVLEVPSNMALAKYGARFWLGRIMLTWGAVTVLMSLMQTEWSLHVMRFLLGAAEAGYSPGVILYLAMWYSPKALGKAVAALNLAVPVALCLGTVITTLILTMDGIAGIAGWRWVFVLEGLPAIALAIIIFINLPSSPAKAKWLTEEEKVMLEASVTQSKSEASHRLSQIPKMLKKGSVWFFALTYFLILAGFWSITYFLPTIVKEQFGLGVIGSGFLSSVPWLVSIAVMAIVAKTTVATGDRTWHMTGLMVASAVGLFLGVVSGSPVASLVGMSLAAAGFFGVLSTFQATIAQVYAGALAAVSIAFVNAVGNVSGLVGPYILGYFKDLTGSTDTGLLIMSGSFALAAVCVFFGTRWADKRTGGISGLV
ncbi:MFS transporter [Glutamicibacter sp. NPDC127525]|uniref:MFS transporter n=1 Tax=unclassified Glutamicibacter TaxID=2627139 RepID=UPI00362F57E6